MIFIVDVLWCCLVLLTWIAACGRATEPAGRGKFSQKLWNAYLPARLFLCNGLKSQARSEANGRREKQSAMPHGFLWECSVKLSGKPLWILVPMSIFWQKKPLFSENLCTFMQSLDGMACLSQHPGRPILRRDIILEILLIARNVLITNTKWGN